MNKKVLIVIGILAVIAIAVVMALMLVQKGSVNPTAEQIPQDAIISDVPVSLSWGNVDVPVPWTVVENDQSDLKITDGKGVELLTVSYDSGEYVDVLARTRARFTEPKINSVVLGTTQGQEFVGVVDETGSTSIVAATILEHDERAIAVVLRDASDERTLALYRSLVQSIVLNEPVASDIVNEYMPPYLRDGVSVVHTFSNGTHTISGKITVPTPCHTVTVTPSLDKVDGSFVLLEFEANIAPDLICAQVITEKDFTVSFNAKEDAVIRASFTRLPLRLLGL